MLQVVETSCALNISQRFGSCHLRPLKNFTTAQCPLELMDELLHVVLHHPIQIDQIAIDIIQNLAFSRLPTQKEQRSATTKQLNVALVRWENWQ